MKDFGKIASDDGEGSLVIWSLVVLWCWRGLEKTKQNTDINFSHIYPHLLLPPDCLELHVGPCCAANFTPT